MSGPASKRTFKLNAAVRDGMINLLKERCFVQLESHFEKNYRKLEENVPPLCGGFGKVFKVYSLENSEEIKAAKHIDLNYECDYSYEGVMTLSQKDTKSIEEFLTVCQEATVLYEIFDHPNVVKCSDMWIEKTNLGDPDNSSDIRDIIEFLESGKEYIDPKTRKALQNTCGLSVYIIMDYYPMNLKEWTRDCNDPSVHWTLIQNIMDGLLYIHDLSYAHLDVKPQNILINPENYNVVLADFGLCIHGTEPIEGMLMERKGTLPYNTAPDRSYSMAFDLWSMGLLVYELRNGVITTCELEKIKHNASEYFVDQLDRKGEEKYIISLVSTLLKPNPDERKAAHDLFLPDVDEPMSEEITTYNGVIDSFPNIS